MSGNCPSGRWQARYRTGAGDLVAARQTVATKREAAQFLAVVEADQLRGVTIDPRGGRTKAEVWAQEWLRTKRGQRANTLARDRAALAHAVPIIGHLPLASVTQMHIRSVIDAICDVGRSPKTVRTSIGTVSALFAAAVEADLIQRSPVRPRSLALERPARRPRPTLTPGELQRLADAVPLRYRALVLVAGVLGLRWSEAIGLRVVGVDFLRRTLTVAQTVEEVAGRVRVVDLTNTDASRRTMSVPGVLIDELGAPRHVSAGGGSGRPDVHRPARRRPESLLPGPDPEASYPRRRPRRDARPSRAMAGRRCLSRYRDARVTAMRRPHRGRLRARANVSNSGRHDRVRREVHHGLRARTNADQKPSWTGWLSVISTSMNPASVSAAV